MNNFNNSIITDMIAIINIRNPDRNVELGNTIWRKLDFYPGHNGFNLIVAGGEL